MIYFLTSLPASLEANAIYYIQVNASTAEQYVADDEGNPVQVSTVALTQNIIGALRGQANGYASLDGSSKVPIAQLPDELQTASEVATQLASKANTADVYDKTTADGLFNAKADASSVYTQSATDALLNGKQNTLTNATDVAKIGDGTFDGKPIITLANSEW